MADEQAGGVGTPVIVGTAGHVDHGKSALVRALTGTDPDRLPQEKARGITIDLGFAELPLPSGRVCGLVDVPGHGHYVRAMVAGATGVDVALLVVAADDGVMPQTREHLRILELVGVRHMVVALTKCDLVEDDDWLELVRADVEEYLGATDFAGSPVIPVSSRTGRGVEELARALDAAVDAFLVSGAQPARQAQPARLPVDRAFNVAGAGTVVTGTLRAGTIAPGDVVELCPQGTSARVRSVQVHGHDVPRAVAGQRTALNLTGVSVAGAARGSTVAASGTLEARDRFDARLTWLGRDGRPAPLASGARVHVCTGTSQALARVLLLDGAAELACGQDALVQVRLEEPLAVRAHDRFVVMAYSPVELVGGGEVLWGAPPRRTTTTSAERALLAASEARDVRGCVCARVHLAPAPVSAGEVAASLDEVADDVTAALEDLVGVGRLVRLEVGQGQARSAAYVVPGALDACVARIGDALAGTFADASEGVSLLALRDVACPRVDEPTFSALVDWAQRRGVAARFGANVISAGLLAAAQGQLDALVATVGGRLSELGLAVPFADELAEALSLDRASVMRALRELERRGEAECVERAYYLSAPAAVEARERVRACIEAHGGSATASDLREALGLSRKYALPLLEHLDQAGFTVRDRSAAGERSLAGR